MEVYVPSTCLTIFVIGDSRNGSDKVFLNESPMSWPKASINMAILTFAEYSSTAPSQWQKKGDTVDKTKCGKGSKIMAVADTPILPVDAHVKSASPRK